jgi:F0F1-type ATP synthase assembly protein I
MLLVVGVQLTLLVLTGVSLWSWHVGFSSAFLGTALILAAIVFTWALIYQEREPCAAAVEGGLLNTNPDGAGTCACVCM